MIEDAFDNPEGEAMEPIDDGYDAFANVVQGLVGEHKTAMLEYWQQAIDDIERISDDGSETDVFKSTVLPLARIKKVMKTDLDVKMISAEAPILFAKGCDIFITELTMRAWIHAEENKRRTLQRSDIAMAIQKSDVFDFLIDIIPREEAQPRRSHRIHEPPSNEYSPQNSVSGFPQMGLQTLQDNTQETMPNMTNDMGGMSHALRNGLSENFNPNLGMMSLGMDQLPQQPGQNQGRSLAGHLQPSSDHVQPQQQSNQNHSDAKPGNPPETASRGLDNLSDVANLGIDVNSLGQGMNGQIPDLSYSGIEAYLETGPGKEKGPSKEDENTPGKSRPAGNYNPPAFNIKDESHEVSSHFANELPFSYNEPVDVSQFGQNF